MAKKNFEVDERDGVKYLESQMQDLIMAERRFLHEISNVLVIANGMTGYLQQTLVVDNKIKLQDLEKIQKAVESLNKANHLIKVRRATLHSMKLPSMNE